MQGRPLRNAAIVSGIHATHLAFLWTADPPRTLFSGMTMSAVKRVGTPSRHDAFHRTRQLRRPQRALPKELPRMELSGTADRRTAVIWIQTAPADTRRVRTPSPLVHRFRVAALLSAAPARSEMPSQKSANTCSPGRWVWRSTTESFFSKRRYNSANCEY